MTNKMKQELINDILTGLLVAAAFAIAVPGEALAQLSTSAVNAQTQIAKPFTQLVSYTAYGLGTVMTVAGIAGAKKHADSPSNNPLGPALGKLGAGAAFLAAPTVVGMLESTGTATAQGNATFSTISGF